MAKLMMGTCNPDDPADAELIKAAGIEWIRLGCPFPFEDHVRGQTTEAYRRHKGRIEQWAEAGLKIMGVTPGPGIGRRERDAQGDLALVWHDRFPEWFGAPGSNRCLANYTETCAWLAEDLRGLVGAWQVCNELDIWQFAGPFNPPQACELILSGARGLKGADPSLLVGHNPTGGPKTYYFAGRLFPEADGLLDYCGIDRYFGSWQAGGPGDWAGLIRELHELTGAPILLNEWGFASAGGVMDAEDRATGRPTCQLGRWPHTWGSGHTPEGQAEFIATAFDAFVEQRDAMLGQFYFRWADQKTCWQCGQPGCPSETAWGLVDVDCNPKPAYYALKAGVERLCAG